MNTSIMCQPASQCAPLSRWPHSAFVLPGYSWQLSTELAPHISPHYLLALTPSQTSLLLDLLARRLRETALGALTTACSPHHSCSSIWGLCSCARCRRHTSESQALSLPSSSASHWLCQPTTCKDFHLQGRGKAQLERDLNCILIISPLFSHPRNYSSVW